MTNKNTQNEPRVAVQKVVIQLGKKELILDIEDARQLQTVLNDLFVKVVVEKAVEEHHHYHEKYPFYWEQPSQKWTLGGNGYSQNDGVVYCSVGASSSTDPKQPLLLEVK